MTEYKIYLNALSTADCTEENKRLKAENERLRRFLIAADNDKESCWFDEREGYWIPMETWSQIEQTLQKKVADQ